MTLSEFKAWFEGFTENLAGAPSAKQFEKIKAKVGEITGAPVTYPIYVDRYVHPYRPYWDRFWASTAGDATSTKATWGEAISSLQAVGRNDGVGVANFAIFGPSAGRTDAGPNQTIEFDSHAAMRELGKMEASH